MNEHHLIRELADREAIRDLIALYARAADRRDWDLIRSIYHEDATDHHEEFAGGVEEFIAWLDAKLKPVKSIHHCLGQTLIDLDGDQAHCETYYVSHSSFPAGTLWAEAGQGRADLLTATAVGRYVDRVERRADGVWRFADRVCVMDFRHVQSFEDRLDPAAARGVAGPTDPVYLLRKHRPRSADGDLIASP